MTSTMANYILNLLRSVGTPESVVQNFAGAGIHHPKDLANLKVSDFPALGVTDPVQQKKILYLVQLVSTKTTMSDEHAETQSPSKRKSKSNLSLPSKSSSSKMDMVAAGNFDDVGADEKKTEDYLTSAGTSPGLDYKHSKSTPDKNSRRSRHQAKLESTALAGSVDDDNIKSPEQPAAGAAAPDSEPRRSDRIKAKNGGSKTKKKEDKKARTIFSSFEKVATVRVVPNSLITSVKKETSTGKWDASAESTLENTRNWSHNEDETATGPTITGALEHPSLTESVVKKKIDNSTVSKTRETSIAENTVTSPDTSKNSDPKSNLASRRSMMISKIPQSNLTGSNRFENSVSPYPNSNLRSTVLSLPSSNPNYNENRYKARISPDDHTKDSKTGSMQVNRNAQCETRSVDDDSLGRTSQSGKTNKLSLPAFDTNDFIPVGGNMNGDVDNGDSKIMSQLRRPKNRARSMYTGLPTLQQDGQSKQLRPPRSKRTSLSTLSRIDDLGLVNSSGLSSVLETPLLSLPTADESSYSLMIDDLREENNKDHNDFHEKRRSDDELHYLDMRIRVVVRKRPMSKTERLKGGIDIIHPLDCGDYGKIIVYNPKTSVDLTKGIDQIKFVFDDVFDESSTNLQIYNRSVRHLIQNFFDGQFVTCFAYGATGSGKTFTMMGSEVTGINAGNSVYNESNVGLYYLAVRDIFSKLQTPEFSGCRLQVSLFEIYGGKLFDLLSTERRKEVKCLEDSKGAMCIKGLGAFSVESPEDVLKFIKLGSANRSTGETSANADSSRSHAVLQISLVEFTSTRKKETEKGRFTFIDLAGSERGADTSSASRSTRQEGADINTSLLALKEVIRALASNANHKKYRGSELTKVLKDSFDGENSRCCMISCISPDMDNANNTLNTLRYADHVKQHDPDSGALPPSCPEPTRKKCWFYNQGRQLSSQNCPVADRPIKAISTMLSASSIPSSSKHKAIERLRVVHQKISIKWSELQKNEYELTMKSNNFNTAEQFDQYREWIKNHIITQQRVLMSELKMALQEYRESTQTTSGEEMHTTVAPSIIRPSTSSNDVFEDSDDDSIEDLRY